MLQQSILRAGFFAVTVCCIWPVANAAEGWTVYLDNDKFGPRDTDRDYTGAFAFSYTASQKEKLLFSLDKLVGLFDTREDHTGTLVMHGFEFGVVAFTPARITISAPQPEDRPYASLLYLSGSRHRVYTRNDSAIASSLTIGALGVAAAHNIQQEIHKLMDSGQPRGWDNQISDGGEPTFRYLWEYRKLQGNYPIDENDRVQWSTVGGFSLGYLTEGMVGVSARYGKLSGPWWSFHSSPTGFGDRMLSVPGQYGNGGGFYTWASLSAKLRLYNAFLQGQFRDSVVTFDHSELRPVIGHLSLGMGWTFPNLWRISYYMQAQTSEIKSGLADRSLAWGGFMLTVPME